LLAHLLLPTLPTSLITNHMHRIYCAERVVVLSSDVSAPVPSQDESDDWIEPVAEKVREIMGDMTIELRKDLIDDLRIMIDGKGVLRGAQTAQ
jgi:hypothetical protein